MSNGRIYDKEKLKEEYSKLKWWQKLIGAFKGRRY